MKNKFVNYLTTILLVIMAIEVIQLGFHFMTLSDTIFFYLGLTIIAIIAFLFGWFSIKELNKIFTEEEKIGEDKK